MLNQDNTAIITIAIPFFNAEKYLGKAIDSVLSQTYQNWKLILLDDGSTDASLEIAKSYKEKDRRIKVYSDGENRNLGYRLNQIPALVNTEYLARMDADDIMHPRKIEKQMMVLIKHTDIDVLGTNAYSIDENDFIIGIRNNYTSSGKDELIDVKGFIHPTIVAKTEWFLANKYDCKAVRIEDTELWYRTSKQFNFKIITEPLLFYREVGKDYYKKYFNANDSKLYILQKHKNNFFWRKFFIQNYLKGIIYYFFNIFGKESYLIVRRNYVSINKKSIKEYIK